MTTIKKKIIDNVTKYLPLLKLPITCRNFRKLAGDYLYDNYPNIPYKIAYDLIEEALDTYFDDLE